MSTEHSYGVIYSPKESPSPTITIEKLKEIGVRYIRLQWVDLTNIIRFRVIPISHFLKLLQSPRPSVSMVYCALGLVALSLAPGFYATGEMLYVPDLSTLKVCPYAPAHASCMGWFQEKLPVINSRGISTLDVELCPRRALYRVVENARKVAGVEFLVGFETEFILLKSTSAIEAGNVHHWSASSALYSGSAETAILEEIADALQESGIEVQMYHPEGAPSQYEVVTGPLPPLQAADALVHTRETIYNIANKHGFRATLAPRVFMNSCGGSTHTHISVHSSDISANTKGLKLSKLESSFLSSLLAHLPEIIALTMPLPASYGRMLDGLWSGGTYVCWGTDNREAPIRLCNASSPASRNFEVRTHDGTANPYLALAGILGAGYVGVKDDAVLNVQNCDEKQTAAEMSEEARRALGITQRLPLTWEDARKSFGRSKTMRHLLGSEFVEKFLSVNEAMSNSLKADSEGEALKVLIQNY